MEKLNVRSSIYTFATVGSTILLLVIGCAGNKVEKATDNTAVESPDLTIADRTMSVEGIITEVMESWPLQLMVETNAGSYYVELLVDTKITENGEDVEASRLMPNVQVIITGEASPTQDNAMTAETIEIK